MIARKLRWRLRISNGSSGLVVCDCGDHAALKTSSCSLPPPRTSSNSQETSPGHRRSLWPVLCVKTRQPNKWPKQTAQPKTNHPDKDGSRQKPTSTPLSKPRAKSFPVSKATFATQSAQSRPLVLSRNVRFTFNSRNLNNPSLHGSDVCTLEFIDAVEIGGQLAPNHTPLKQCKLCIRCILLIIMNNIWNNFELGIASDYPLSSPSFHPYFAHVTGGFRG